MKKLMTYIITIIAIALSVILLTLSYSLALAQGLPGSLPYDEKRGVLSFSNVLNPAFKSVTLIHSGSSSANGSFIPKSVGSGVIINGQKGLIITNSHVVAGSNRFRIQLADHRWLDAELAGTDAPSDIALLKTDPLPNQIQIADSDLSRVGDIVFALGYPLGLEQTLTFGIISGLSRNSGGASLNDFIQTDAAINSGNSGGALLNSKGELIGINTSIISQSGGSIGIGFSVPSRMALSVAKQLEKFGEVRRGAVGIVINHVSEEDSKRVGIDNWDGATIVRIEEGSPADIAGLQAGDVITKFNNRHVTTADSLRAWIGVSEAETPLEFTYLREGKPPETIIVHARALNITPVSGLNSIGINVRPISESDNIPEKVKGIFIHKLDEGSPAELAGLMQGDVIVAVNDEFAASRQVCDRLVHEAEGIARFVVYRGNMLIPIIVQF